MKAIVNMIAGLCLAATAAAGDDAWLRTVSQKAMEFFLAECHTNGLVRGRGGDPALFATAGGGFQLTVSCLAAEQGLVARQEAARRVRALLPVVAALPRFHGFWARHYDLATLSPLPYEHPLADGGDTLATAMLAAGLITCLEYFDADVAEEADLRAQAADLVAAVEWNWMLNRAGNPCQLLSRWSPRHEFAAAEPLGASRDLSAGLAYILALGAADHAIPPECWDNGWAATYEWWTNGPAPFILCPPLAAHELSQVWLDLRNQSDGHADYFRNSFLALCASREWTLRAVYPEAGLWGVSDAEGPHGYRPYGYPPLTGQVLEDAVLVPATLAGAVVFLPRESTATLRALFDQHAALAWGRYGFFDSLSPRRAWSCNDYTSVNLGLMACMLENQAQGTPWSWFMRNAQVRRGLDQAGFTAVLDDCEPAGAAAPYCTWEASAAHAIRLATNQVRQGRHALAVTIPRGAEAAAALVAHPAQQDLAAYTWLSLWMLGDATVRVDMVEASGAAVPLAEDGTLIGDDGWRHLYFRLPPADVLSALPAERIRFKFQAPEDRAEETVYLDAMTFTRRQSLKPPPTPGHLEAVPTRMRGEIMLSWSPATPPAGAMPIARYLLKTSRQPIKDEERFQEAADLVPVAGRRIPASMGRFYVSGLAPGGNYYFAIKSEDQALSRSGFQQYLSVRVPHQPQEDEFLLDDFDGSDKQPTRLAWRSLTPGATIQTVPDALEGARSLRVQPATETTPATASLLVADLDIRDFSYYRHVALWVFGQAAIQLRLEDDQGRHEDLPAQAPTAQDGWAPIFFDLAALSRLDPRDIARMYFIITPTAATATAPLYFDSLRLTRFRE